VDESDENEDSAKCLRMVFDCPISYRSAYDEYRLAIGEFVFMIAEPWALFTLDNSEFAQWIEHASCGRIKVESVTNYVVVTKHTIFEVLAESPPSVSWVDKPTQQSS
jgi:hypothetical protein